MTRGADVALLGSARPARVGALLARLAGRGACELVCTRRFDRGGFDGVPRVTVPEDRFSAAAGARLPGRYATVAIPYAHANEERHEYRNVEEFAAALGAARVIRLYAHELLVESDAPAAAEVARFHERAAADFARRKQERLAELAAFTGRPLAGLEQRCTAAEAEGFALWRAAAPRTAAEVAAFYRDHDFYLEQLTQANFFSGGRTEHLATIWSALGPGRRVLEFGFGVGEVILELARRGCEATAVDSNPRLVDFVRFKAARRGLRVDAGTALPDRRFDAIVALDVLEHLPDPEPALAALVDRLQGPRLLIIRLPDEAEPVPMHFAGTRATVEAALHRLKFRRQPAATSLDVYRGERETE